MEHNNIHLLAVNEPSQLLGTSHDETVLIHSTPQQTNKKITAHNFRPTSGSTSQHFQADEIPFHQVPTPFCRI